MAEMAAANKQSTQPKITKGIKMACRALKNVAKSLMPLPPPVLLQKVLGPWSLLLWSSHPLANWNCSRRDGFSAGLAGRVVNAKLDPRNGVA